MGTNTPKKWYQKKSYIIPSIVIVGFITLSSISEPKSSTTTHNNQLDLPTVQNAPENTTPEVSTPENEVELKLETIPTPQPTPTQPKAKPTPSPNSKPTKQVSPTPSPTQTKSSCDPNYSGGCVPIASDVDCAGGSGNGPTYFRGTATVIGSDIYDLDRDNDGVACE